MSFVPGYAIQIAATTLYFHLLLVFLSWFIYSAFAYICDFLFHVFLMQKILSRSVIFSKTLEMQSLNCFLFFVSMQGMYRYWGCIYLFILQLGFFVTLHCRFLNLSIL